MNLKEIQGGTSEVMSCGFFNTIRQSIRAGWETPINTFIIVHDSSTSAVQVSKLFELRPFLDKHYTDFCMGLGSGVCLKFDLLQGNSYESAAGVTQIDENTLEYKGNAMTLLPIYDKIMNCSSYKVECSMKREDIIPKYVDSPVLRFIKAKGTSMVMDESKYKIQFKKIA